MPPKTRLYSSSQTRTKEEPSLPTLTPFIVGSSSGSSQVDDSVAPSIASGHHVPQKALSPKVTLTGNETNHPRAHHQNPIPSLELQSQGHLEANSAHCSTHSMELVGHVNIVRMSKPRSIYPTMAKHANWAPQCLDNQPALSLTMDLDPHQIQDWIDLQKNQLMDCSLPVTPDRRPWKST